MVHVTKGKFEATLIPLPPKPTQQAIVSKKLKIIVDLGDSPEQIKLREEYSDVLTNRKSYAAILNYMVENEYELVETLTLEEGSSFQGTGSGGTSGVIFIMKRRK